MIKDSREQSIVGKQHKKNKEWLLRNGQSCCSFLSLSKVLVKAKTLVSGLDVSIIEGHCPKTT